MNDDTTNDQSFVKRLNETIILHLADEKFGVPELAREMGVSKSQLHRQLQIHTGKSTSQLIREARLKKGKELLEKEEYTVAEVAYKVGFNSPTYFNTSFREFYGHAPGETKARKTSKNNTNVFVSSRNVWFAIITLLILAIFYFSFRLVLNNNKKTDKSGESNASIEISILDKSIVVIPFEYGGDTTYNHYSIGMVSEILNQLYTIGDLDVKSDISSKRFKNTNLSVKEIGEAFGVSYILTGSSLTVGNVIRINPQLFNTETNELIWTYRFTANISDVSEIVHIQTEIAEQVALGCKATISSRETDMIHRKPGTTNELAYNFYLKGQIYWNSQGDNDLAIVMYSRAIEADPSFTAAYARRAIMHAHLYHAKYSDNWLDHDRMASEDIKKAKQLDPQNIEVKIAEAIYHYYIDLNYSLGISILNELKENAPNMSRLYAYVALMKSRQGKWDECIEELNRAVELEPFNVVHIRDLSVIYERLREFDKSIEIAREGLEKVPDHVGFRKRIFGAMRKKTGDLDLAMEIAGLERKNMQRQYYLNTRQFDKLIEYINNEDFAFAGPNNFHPKSHELAHAYFFKGDTIMSRIYADSAIQLLERKLNENPLDHRLAAPLSKCYAFLGDREKAIKYGKQSISDIPVEVDAHRGIGRETEFLKTYAILGENELALEQIEYLLSIPGFLTIGDLWLRPEYYNLRKIPRFQEIIRSELPELLEDNEVL